LLLECFQHQLQLFDQLGRPRAQLVEQLIAPLLQ
jgi:hypothetical protein